MSNLAANHHHGGEGHERSHDIAQPVHLNHVPVDHYRLIPKRESRDTFDSTGRLDESYEVKKKIQEGDLRLERHSGAGTQAASVRAPPKKGGHGGKYTWEGQYRIGEQDDAPAALDSRDPNYDEASAAPELLRVRKTTRKKDERVEPSGQGQRGSVVEKQGVRLGGKPQPDDMVGSAQPLHDGKKPGENDHVLSPDEVGEMAQGVDISEFLTQAVDQMQRRRKQVEGPDEGGDVTRDARQEQDEEGADISTILMPDPMKYCK